MNNILPTAKQTKAFQETINGNSVSSAMLKAGYKPKTAKNPINLTASRGWEELMEKHLPDKELAKVHKQLLHKKETIIIREGKESKVELTEQPHSDAKGALDMAYKLKRKYPTENESGITNNILIIPSEAIERHDRKTDSSAITNS